MPGPGGSGPVIPGTGTSEPSMDGEGDAGTYTEYYEEGGPGGPSLVFGGAPGGGYTAPGPGGTGGGGYGGGGSTAPGESSDDSSTTPSYVTRPDPDMPNPEDVLRSEYQALIDGSQWPITTLDESTTITAPTMYVMSGDVISQKMSTKYPGCLAMMEMVQRDSWIPNTGWNTVDADILDTKSWWGAYAAYATASIGIWKTPYCCTYTDPDQGVIQTYWANLFGHAAQPKARGYTMGDPTVRDGLYRNAGPVGSITSFGSKTLPDPLEYTSTEKAALKTKFGYTHLAGGEPLAECIYRLNRSLDNILDSLETGFVPRTDVIKIVPRLKIENRMFERITQKENKQDVMIGQVIGNPNVTPNVVNLSARIAVSTSRRVAVATMVPGMTAHVGYVTSGGAAPDHATHIDTGSGMLGGGMGAGEGAFAPAGSAPTPPGPTLGPVVGGAMFPGPIGGPPTLGGSGGFGGFYGGGSS